jgi:hypothetical protein
MRNHFGIDLLADGRTIQAQLRGRFHRSINPVLASLRMETIQGTVFHGEFTDDGKTQRDRLD